MTPRSASLLTSGLLCCLQLDPPPNDFISGRRFLNLRDLAEEQTVDIQLAARQAREQGEERRALFLETMASEHEAMFGASAQEIEAIDDFGDLPLVVIVSGVPNPEFGDSAIAFQDFWVESSRTLAGKSRGGEFLFATESGHHIHRDAPELTRVAIELLIDFARGRTHDRVDP